MLCHLQSDNVVTNMSTQPLKFQERIFRKRGAASDSPHKGLKSHGLDYSAQTTNPCLSFQLQYCIQSSTLSLVLVWKQSVVDPRYHARWTASSDQGFAFNMNLPLRYPNKKISGLAQIPKARRANLRSDSVFSIVSDCVELCTKAVGARHWI